MKTITLKEIKEIGKGEIVEYKTEQEAMKAVIKQSTAYYKEFFVMCTQDDNATHGFPFKYYATLKGATKYAEKFISNNSK